MSSVYNYVSYLVYFPPLDIMRDNDPGMGQVAKESRRGGTRKDGPDPQSILPVNQPGYIERKSMKPVIDHTHE